MTTIPKPKSATYNILDRTMSAPEAGVAEVVFEAVVVRLMFCDGRVVPVAICISI